MKYFVCLVVIIMGAVAGIEVAWADTTPDRTRAVITRSSDVNERTDRFRGGDSESENQAEDAGNGEGVSFDVTYNSQSGLDIQFEASGEPGDVSISVSINGESVDGTGGQQTGGNTSSDGADGSDGSDGDAEVEDDPVEDSSESDEEEIDERTETRPTRDLNGRSTTDRDRR